MGIQVTRPALPKTWAELDSNDRGYVLETLTEAAESASCWRGLSRAFRLAAKELRALARKKGRP